MELKDILLLVGAAFTFLFFSRFFSKKGKEAIEMPLENPIFKTMGEILKEKAERKIEEAVKELEEGKKPQEGEQWPPKEKDFRSKP